MNASEKELAQAIEEYGSAMQKYGRLISDISKAIGELQKTEEKLADIDSVLEKHKNSRLRPLSFIRSVENLPTIKKDLIEKLKQQLLGQ